jgi:hypothetical protein
VLAIACAAGCAATPKEKTTMTNQEAWAIYQSYVNGWKSISAAEREQIATAVLAPEVRYATPRHESGGRHTIIGDEAAFQERFPGGHFAIGDVSAHHDVALLTWVLVKADGAEVARGHDQIRVAAGKIVELITFAPSVEKP